MAIPKLPAEVLLLVLILGLCHSTMNSAHGEKKLDSTKQPKLLVEKDFRWPNKQLNILVDTRSINETERQILAATFDQIEHKTCIKVKRLSPDTVNPFDTKRLPETERNFIYIFKAQFGLSHNEHPPLGLSSFGCMNQGRQSMVLGDLTFRWPELLLRYHVLKSLGVANLSRPDTEVRHRLNVLPLSQKIDDESRRHSEHDFDPAPALFAYATFAGLAPTVQKNGTENMHAASDTISVGAHNLKPPSLAARQPTIIPVKYLSDVDLNTVKELYNCSDYENRLSTKPLNEFVPGQLGLAAAAAAAAAAANSKLSNLYSPSNGEKLNATTLSPESSTYTTLIDDTRNSTDISDDGSPTTYEGPISGGLIDVTDRMSTKINDTKIDEAAKSIMNQLLSEESQDKPEGKLMDLHNRTSEFDTDSNESSTTPPSPSGQCKPLESCQIDNTDQQQQQQLEGSFGQLLATDAPHLSLNEPDASQEKPMMLKLDEFHSQDPQLQQANQIKLSQLSNGSFETYRLMNAADLTPQQQFQLAPQTTPTSTKSEMLISFEQSKNPSPAPTSDPVAALASSQVLKLCSCTCQTMAPVSPSSQPQPLPPATPTTTTTACPTTHDPWPLTPQPPSTSEHQLPSTHLPTFPSNEPKTTTQLPPITTTIKNTTTTSEKYTSQPTSELPTTDIPTENPAVTGGWPNATSSDEAPQWTTIVPPTSIFEALPSTGTSLTTPSSNQGAGSIADNPCDQVQWVKPNKTVYNSAKIVWDVDQGNQNYFLCNNQINGELIPGKTHGFSCKVGNEGRAHELHNFNVLTKPESVSLAWVQRTGGSLGKTNLPVIGGHSKGQDPLVVSRCMVRDENNDVITLIGYINSLGVGLFPFDDIQIECSQYDVLACVS